MKKKKEFNSQKMAKEKDLSKDAKSWIWIYLLPFMISIQR